MDQSQALSRLRLAIGNPPVNGVGCVYDYTLGMALEDALTRLFQELECRMVAQPTMIALAVDQYAYPLPNDVMRVLTVRVGDTHFLQPDNVYRASRDGLNWQTAQSSTPARFFQESRNLVLYPPPDATTVAGSPFAALFYIANSPGIQSQGVPGITENDLLAALYDAAVVLDGLATPANEAEVAAVQKRMTVNSGLAQKHLHFSKRNWQSPLPLRASRMSIGGRRPRFTR